MNIAIGIIYNKQDQILITQRALNTSYGGYWEFPGGKIEAHEQPEQAIIRELKEELNLDVHDPVYLGVYPEEHDFYLFAIKEFSGNLKLCADQLDAKWVSAATIEDYQFPPSNLAFFAVLNFHQS